MRRITTLFLALLLTLSLTACGGTAQPNPPAQTGDDASQTETPDTAPEPAEEPEEPQQEPYVISSPTVDRGTVDGVTYVQVGSRTYEVADDVLCYLSAGASAVQVGAQNLVDPLACKRIIEDLPRKMAQYGIESLQSIIGRAHQ